MSRSQSSMIGQIVAMATLMTPSGAAVALTQERNQAVYVAMPDGIRLAVETWLPEGLKEGQRVPTVVSFTRYWRAIAFDPPRHERPEYTAVLNAGGYAVVTVDVRGTGASYGSRQAELSVCETKDSSHIVDWIATQNWSNGKVVASGTSYVGNTAENAAIAPSKALVAVVPKFTDFDWFTSLVYPGGIQNTLIAHDWGVEVKALDNNQLPDPPTGLGRALGVKPVDADADGRLLAAAIAEHAENRDLTLQLAQVRFRDQVPVADNLDQSCDRLVTPYRFQKAERDNRIPAFHWGSWMDAGTAAGVLARFSYSQPNAKYIIGAWSHGAAFDADPLRPVDTPVDPDKPEQFRQIFEFLAPYTQGGAPPEQKPELTYYTMGQRVWKHTSVWPPTGSTTATYYLAANGELLAKAPKNPSGIDRYAVNFEVGTGKSTRWSTQMGGDDVYYGDRAIEDRSLQSYTTAPLSTDLEVTGHPIVEIFVASTDTDGAVIAYLETVDPAGRVSMITEGELRLIDRAVSSQSPEFPQFGPYHTYLESASRPMIPGKIERIAFHHAADFRTHSGRQPNATCHRRS